MWKKNLHICQRLLLLSNIRDIKRERCVTHIILNYNIYSTTVIAVVEEARLLQCKKYKCITFKLYFVEK